MHDWVLNNKNPCKVESVWSPSETMTVWIKVLRIYYSWYMMTWADPLQLRQGGTRAIQHSGDRLAASEGHVQQDTSK